MSSPIFDSGTGKRFTVKLIENVMYGISLTDDRKFKASSHSVASIINIVLIIPSIIISFIGKSVSIIIA